MSKKQRRYLDGFSRAASWFSVDGKLASFIPVSLVIAHCVGKARQQGRPDFFKGYADGILSAYGE